MDIVLRESDRLNDTIRSFLSYARPQPLAAGPVDLGRLLRDTATLLRNSPEVLPRTASTSTPPTPARCRWPTMDRCGRWCGTWPPTACGRCPRAAARPARARGRAVDRARRASLEVVDEGVGIAPEQLDTLFQPFHGSFARGTGLGLAIVHRIVSDHRGEVQVESEVGKGTTVLVKLPLRRLLRSGPSQRRRQCAQGAPRGRAGAMRSEGC